MSENQENQEVRGEESEVKVDQITSIPKESAINSKKSSKDNNRKKDPKKVAAGKALAKKNKEAREALKRSHERENSNEVSPLSFLDVNNGLQVAAGVVGSVFVLYRGYKYLYPSDGERVVHEMVKTNSTEISTQNEEPKKENKVNIDME